MQNHPAGAYHMFGIDIHVIRRNAIPAQVMPIRINHHCLSSNGYAVRVLFKIGHLQLDASRIAQVIGIHAHENLSARSRYPFIQRLNQATIFACVHDAAGVSFGKLP